MQRNDNFTTSYSLFATIVTSVIGISVFSYASDLSAIVGSDSWIIIILNTLISFVLIYLMYKIIEMNNFKGFYQILEDNFGKLIGSIVCLVFIIYNIIYISAGLRVFIEEIKIYLLEKTPTEFLIIITILTAIYLIRGEIDTLIKFNEVTFWFSFIPVILILFFALYEIDFTNLLPIFNNSPQNYMKAINKTIIRFKGIEMVFLVVPFMKKKDKTPKVLLKSMIFIGLFYLYVVILSIAMFSTEQIKNMLWSGIVMIRSIDIPGAFVERWDGIVMAIWVMFFFTTFGNAYYFSADVLKDVFKIKDIKITAFLIAPSIYVISLYPQNVTQVYNISKNIQPYLFFITNVVIIIVLFILSKIKNKNKNGVKRKKV